MNLPNAGCLAISVCNWIFSLQYPLSIQDTHTDTSIFNVDIYLSINQEILIPSDQIFLKERQQIYHPASTISDIQIVDKQKELWICAKLSHYW